MTPAQADKIAKLAGAVVLSTPRRKSKYAFSAYVPYDIIEKLRDALVEAGWDMAAARQRMVEIERERKKERA